MVIWENDNYGDNKNDSEMLSRISDVIFKSNLNLQMLCEMVVRTVILVEAKLCIFVCEEKVSDNNNNQYHLMAIYYYFSSDYSI